MSYEGYTQYLCQNGHYAQYDVYDSDRPKCCAECQAEFVWTNEVDQTNCEEQGYVDLTPFRITPSTYRIPQKCVWCEGHKYIPLTGVLCKTCHGQGYV